MWKLSSLQTSYVPGALTFIAKPRLVSGQYLVKVEIKIYRSIIAKMKVNEND